MFVGIRLRSLLTLDNIYLPCVSKTLTHIIDTREIYIVLLRYTVLLCYVFFILFVIYVPTYSYSIINLSPGICCMHTKAIALRSPTPSNNYILDCCCGILSTPLAIVKLLTSYILISVFILPPYNVGVVDCCMRIKILLSYPRCHQLSAVFGITPSARMVDCCVSLAVNSLD